VKEQQKGEIGPRGIEKDFKETKTQAQGKMK